MSAEDVPEGLIQYLVGVLIADVHEYVGDGTYGVPDWEGLVVRLREPARYLAQCLLGWMGPGGDFAFLEMYLLACQYLPPWGFFERRTQQMLDDVARNDRRMTLFNPQYGLSVASQGQIKRHHGSAAYLRGVLEDELDHMQQYHLLHFLGTTTTPYVMLYPHETTFMQVTWVVAPPADYRTLLMGELASPWQAPATFPDRLYEPQMVMP